MSDYTLADTIYLMFTTRAFASGVPTVLAGSPVVSAYENENLTQITAGVTLGVDHDAVAGLNLLTIVATGANGFEDGKDYNLVITAGTVGGVSVVGEVVGTFSLGRSAASTVADTIVTNLATVDTVVDAILVDTGTTLDAALAVVDATADAIKVATDKLTFTVANQIDANVQYINDVAITGDGGATPFDVA